MRSFLHKEAEYMGGVGSLLCMTFTVAGVESMKKVFSQDLPEVYAEALPRRIRTLHSFCYMLVKSYDLVKFGEHLWSAVDTKIFKALTGYTVEPSDLSTQKDNLTAWDWGHLYSLWRTAPERFAQYEGKYDKGHFSHFCNAYLAYKQEHKTLDFTDMLESVARYIPDSILKETSGVTTLLLDECQDISPLQWDIIFNAFPNLERLYCAYDTSQSIFGWAGADPSVIEKMPCNLALHAKYSLRVPRILQLAAEATLNTCSKVTPHKPIQGIDRPLIYERVPYFRDVEIRPDVETFILVANRFVVNSMGIAKYLRLKCLRYDMFGRDVLSKAQIELYINTGKLSKIGKRHLDDEQLMYVQRIHANRGLDYLRAKPKVHIYTPYQVKGLSADDIILMQDMCKGVKQYIAYDPDHEVKLFYVAVTRARERLVLVEPANWREAYSCSHTFIEAMNMLRSQNGHSN